MTAKMIRKKLDDTTGASIVIALVFFLICAVVGSTVLTAATINSQATATYKKSREQEYTVNSAAALMAKELQEGVRVTWDWDNVVNGIPAATVVPNNGLAARLWGNNVDILQQRALGKSYVIGNTQTDRIAIEGVSGMNEVYATLEVTRDLDIYLRLSLDADPAALSAYDETVYLQCIATYSGEGKLIAAEWKPAVVTKGNTGGGTP